MKKFNIKKHYNKFIKQYYDKISNYNYGKYTQNEFREIFILAIIILFSCIIYLSLPVFYNYESFDKELRNKIYKDFKFDIQNTKGITYSIIPRPHLLIETSNLFLTTNSEKEFAKINNLYEIQTYPSIRLVSQDYVRLACPLILSNSQAFLLASGLSLHNVQ